MDCWFVVRLYCVVKMYFDTGTGKKKISKERPRGSLYSFWLSNSGLLFLVTELEELEENHV
jgi:hypothetical protein